MAEDKEAQETIEHAEKPAEAKNHPPAGPHAKDHLVDREKTPGTGSLPDPGASDPDTKGADRRDADIGPD